MPLESKKLHMYLFPGPTRKSTQLVWQLSKSSPLIKLFILTPNQSTLRRYNNQQSKSINLRWKEKCQLPFFANEERMKGSLNILTKRNLGEVSGICPAKWNNN